MTFYNSKDSLLIHSSLFLEIFELYIHWFFEGDVDVFRVVVGYLRVAVVTHVTDERHAVVFDDLQDCWCLIDECCVLVEVVSMGVVERLAEALFTFAYRDGPLFGCLENLLKFFGFIYYSIRRLIRSLLLSLNHSFLGLLHRRNINSLNICDSVKSFHEFVDLPILFFL